MLSFKGRVYAAICVGLLYLSGGSIATGGTLLSRDAFLPPRENSFGRIEVCRLLVGNAASDSQLIDCRLRNSKLTAGLGNREVDALNDNAAVVAPVVLLDVPVCPPTITRFIVPIAADTIERQSRGNFAHIGKEVLELLPSLADFDAAPAVLMKVFGLGIGAPPLHRNPASVGAVSRSAPARPPVGALRQILQGDFGLQASARSGRPVSQLRLVNDDIVPAGAAA